MLKSLPIGHQSFEKLISRNCVYVDKTALIYKLIQEGTVYFLSRPRRFGKSLLLSTIEAIFQGKRELFNGLWIDQSDYDWKPVTTLRLDMSTLPTRTAQIFEDELKKLVLQIARQYGITLEDSSPYDVCFNNLLIALGNRFGRIAVLVDEYDSPMLNEIQKPEKAARIDDQRDMSKAFTIQQLLRDFYGKLKAQDQYIQFLMLTGVSKFTRVSVFSELNHLNDISMTENFAGLLGYTQDELEYYFSDYIDRLRQKEKSSRQEILEKIKRWYNGYLFDPDGPSVYNPFSTLLLFNHLKFKPHWFETGTPTFLINLLKGQVQVPLNLEKIEVDVGAFSAFDITRLAVLPILFQTGYITIKSYNPENDIYTLDYPNEEVRKAFLKILIQHFADKAPGQSEMQLIALRDAILTHDLPRFFDLITCFFAQIPYTIQPSKIEIDDKDNKSESDIQAETAVRLRQREFYYQSLFYLIFALMDLRPEAEKVTNCGRIDTVVETETTVYLFEFKLDKPADDALKQILDNRYPDQFRHLGKSIQLVGVSFSTTDRNVGSWVSQLI